MRPSSPTFYTTGRYEVFQYNVLNHRTIWGLPVQRFKPQDDMRSSSPTFYTTGRCEAFQSNVLHHRAIRGLPVQRRTPQDDTRPSSATFYTTGRCEAFQSNVVHHRTICVVQVCQWGLHKFNYLSEKVSKRNKCLAQKPPLWDPKTTPRNRSSRRV